MAHPTIIMGFDPGETTGFAKLHLVDREIEVMDYGLIPVKSEKFYSEVWKWLEGYLHQIVFEDKQLETLKDRLFFGIEAPIPRKIYAGGQVKSDEVRGMLKAAAEDYGIKYYLYQATSVKKSFGSGRYTKAQLRRVVQMVLKTGPLKSPDVADALAVATCCALREFKADLGMENSYQPAPRPRRKKKKISEYTDDQIRQAIQEKRVVMKGKRIVKIIESRK